MSQYVILEGCSGSGAYQPGMREPKNKDYTETMKSRRQRYTMEVKTLMGKLLSADEKKISDLGPWMKRRQKWGWQEG